MNGSIQLHQMLMFHFPKELNIKHIMNKKILNDSDLKTPSITTEKKKKSNMSNASAKLPRGSSKFSDHP